MIRRAVLAVAAAAAAAVCAAILLVALAFTLYYLVLPLIGPAAACAVVAGAALVIAILAILVLALAIRPKKGRALRGGGIKDRAMSFLREKPVLAIAAAVAAGFLAVRNPRYLGGALRAFVDDDGRRR